MQSLRNCVYDVGMHKGEDSDFYLKKGFRVVGFEADPDLAESCRQRFSEQIKTEQLTVVEGAIVDAKKHNESCGKIKFFKNKKSVWGTVVDDWANRNNEMGSGSEIIEVSTVDFSECLSRFGIPYYMKTDIEGMDLICLKALEDFSARPDYISIESEKTSFDKLLEEFRILTDLGYTSFQVVNQSKITSNKEPICTEEGKFLNYQFQRGASGLFGKDLNKNEWKNEEETILRYKKIFDGYKWCGDDSRINKILPGRVLIKSMNLLFGFPGWYDTHAKHSTVKS